LHARCSKHGVKEFSLLYTAIIKSFQAVTVRQASLKLADCNFLEVFTVYIESNSFAMEYILVELTDLHSIILKPELSVTMHEAKLKVALVEEEVFSVKFIVPSIGYDWMIVGSLVEQESTEAMRKLILCSAPVDSIWYFKALSIFQGCCLVKALRCFQFRLVIRNVNIKLIRVDLEPLVILIFVRDYYSYG